ncbi:MAG: LCP family protein [Chloroflexota bacterium]|nr:LCP family protein [Chloroflexota bacterium]MDE2946953.1 LCP family protein [Chloroflexota bacterium]
MSHQVDGNSRVASAKRPKEAGGPPAQSPSTAGNAAPVYSTAEFTRRAYNPARPPASGPLTGARFRLQRRRQRRWRNEWAWVILAAGMISVFAFLVLAMIVLIRVPQSLQEVIPTAELTPALPTPVNARSEFIADGRRVGIDVLKLDDGSLIEMIPWDGQSRYTIIVGGLDRRPDQVGEPVRTDSLMLVSIDPQAGRIGVLSIPRDLWVRIPEQEKRDRINRAYFIGESRAAGYGARLLQQTVSWNLGMRVHNYVLVDFQALIDVVNHLGGIEVSIDYTIDDERFPDMNYGYDPFYLPAGTHVLDGRDALRFARTRHGNNDVRRAERQQMVLYAIRERVLGLNFVRLIAQLPALLGTLEAHVQTGLNLEQIVQLAFLLRDIDFDKISMRVMDFGYLEEYITEEYQQQVLVPRVERLPILLTQTFGEDYAR